MKRVFISLLLFFSIQAFSQVSDVKVLRITDDTTTFSRNISIGNQVYDINTGELWVANAAVISTATLTTASASFDLINGSGDDVSTFSEKTGDLVGTDRLVGLSSTTDFNETISNIPLSIFNNDNNFVSTATSTTNTNTVISLANPLGNFCNMGTANTNTTFTTTGAVTGGTARVKINTTSQPTVTGATLDGGSGWIASTDLYMTVYYDGTTTRYYFTSTFPKTPTLSKSISIPDPVATDDVTLFYTPTAITITNVASHITGTTNVVFNIGHASTRTGTQLDVFTSDITLTSTTGQTNNTGFNDATIPANSWVWLDAVSVSGTPTLFSATIIYTED